MGKKGGDSRVKRQMAPSFWNIKRKQSQFVLRVRPGPHPKNRSYPLGMVLRDVLGLASTMHEAQKIVLAGKVMVDGITRYDVNFAVGLMDVIELAVTGQSYRLVPKGSKPLVPIAIESSEKSVKLVKITHKTMTKGKRLQYGFHDGKTVISGKNFAVGDTCIIQLPDAQITDSIKFEKNCLALIISGENAGKIGKVDDLREGLFSLPTRALVSIEDRSVELPVEMVMAIGSDKPVIKVS